MRIDPGPFDAETVVLPVIWKVKSFGVVTWVDVLFGSGGR